MRRKRIVISIVFMIVLLVGAVTMRKRRRLGGGIDGSPTQPQQSPFQAMYNTHPPLTNHYFSTIGQSTSNLHHPSHPINGFQFCLHISGHLDVFTFILPLGKTVGEWNPLTSSFINFIDSVSYDLYFYMMTVRNDLDQQEAKRLACYLTLLNVYPLTPLTISPIVIKYNTTKYFESVLPAVIPTIYQKKEYHIAYLLMVHNEKTLFQIKQLLLFLDSTSTLILIHVDLKAQRLYSMISQWIVGRDNMHMAKNRFSNIWGHVSLVYTQLCGFWELYDLGTWSHVMNLSSEDWPLMTNKPMYEFLSRNKGISFIHYWFDTHDLSSRMSRAHLALQNRKETVHLQELGLQSHPNVKVYKHHQWMTLSYDAVAYFRSSEALELLAKYEFTFIPDESFFATVLLNSQFRSKVVNDNHRYVRIKGAHPDWLGYKDRFYFPPNPQSPVFFIRKLKIDGNVFQEEKLLDWIQENQKRNGTVNGCSMMDASGDSRCLGQWIRNRTTTHSSSVIVIPVNEGFLELVQNLECSLSQLGLKSRIVFWALDIATHEYMIRTTRISIFLPQKQEMTGLHRHDSQPLVAMMKLKPTLIEFVMNAGVDVWFLDGDSVVFKDFTGMVVDEGVDVLVGLASGHYTMGNSLSTSTLFFRNTVGSRSILRMWNNVISSSGTLDESMALKKVLGKIHVLEPGRNRTVTSSDENGVVQYLDGELFTTAGQGRYHRDVFVVHVQSNTVDTLKSKQLWFMHPQCQPIHFPQPQ
jgi:hypothetical protein